MPSQLQPHFLFNTLHTISAFMQEGEIEAEGGEVTVTVARERGALRLAVRDDGPGLSSTEPSPRSGSGVGLSNTRARLEHLYGDRHRFTISSHPEGGVLVDLSISLRTAPQGESRRPRARFVA